MEKYFIETSIQLAIVSTATSFDKLRAKHIVKKVFDSIDRSRDENYNISSARGWQNPETRGAQGSRHPLNVRQCNAALVPPTLTV